MCVLSTIHLLSTFTEFKIYFIIHFIYFLSFELLRHIASSHIVYKYQCFRVSVFSNIWKRSIKMTTVWDLYAKLNEPDTYVEPVTPKTPSITELLERDPAQVAIFDQSNESSIQMITDKLISHLSACDSIVDASYVILKYVPGTINSDEDKIWEEV